MPQWQRVFLLGNFPQLVCVIYGLCYVQNGKSKVKSTALAFFPLKHWKLVDRVTQISKILGEERKVCGFLLIDWYEPLKSGDFFESSCIACQVIYLEVGNKTNLKFLSISLSTKNIIFLCFAVMTHRPLLSLCFLKIVDPQTKKIQIIMMTALILYEIMILLNIVSTITAGVASY